MRQCHVRIIKSRIKHLSKICLNYFPDLLVLKNFLRSTIVNTVGCKIELMGMVPITVQVIISIGYLDINMAARKMIFSENQQRKLDSAKATS